MQKASARVTGVATTTFRLLHREESQAIVLGAALAEIAGNDTKQRALCVAQALRSIRLQLHADSFRPTKPPATLMREEI